MATRYSITPEEREVMWNMDDAYIASVERQIKTGQYLARISPLASYVYASTTLAQTGIEDYRVYLQRVKHWVREDARKGTRTKFEHQNSSLDQSLSEIAIDVLWLFLWNIFLFMGANLAFLRYDIR